LGMDIFEYVSWYIHIRDYYFNGGLLLQFIFKLNIGKETNQTRIYIGTK